VVTPSGKIGVVAGDGIPGYRGDGRLGALAELNQPTGVAVDGQGDVYIADSANSVIRRVDARTGIITTVAGDYAADQANDGQGGDTGDGGPATQAELQDPQGVAIDSAGNLFIADTFNNAIRVVTPAGTISTLWSGQGTPYAVATDPTAAGTVYFADASSSKIEKGTYTDTAAAASPSASS
jgi:sugar lactone lactonase YvrE